MSLIGGILTAFALLLEVEPKQQYFLVKPSDTEVIEGLTAMLQCRIKNLAGAVQWSKDGFLLGFDPAIPGFRRYSMMIDKKEGIYNLRISNTMIEDEGKYQCQVGPAPDEGPIRAGAQLTVLVPPNELTVNGRPGHAVLRIKEGERANLTCSARRSKPSSRLKWYRNRVELIPEAAKTFTRERTEKLQTVLSTLVLYPKMDDDEATYICEADHPALPSPLTSSVTISVLYLPGNPVIRGYREGDILMKGDTLSLSCTSKGGNPPPQLIWYRFDRVLDTTYTTRSSKTVNNLRFTVAASDNRAVYRCEATTSLINQPMSALLTLSVHYLPEKIYLEGPSNARRGDTITVACTTSPSNPPVEVIWTVDGKPVTSGDYVTENDSNGWIITSNLTVTLTRQDPDTKRFVCRAVNSQIGFTEGEKEIKVTYPPGTPTIVGYSKGLTIQAGSIRRFDCVSLGGNPLASLQWYRGTKQISTVSSVTGSGVSSELVIKARREDNGATYRCEASNLATTEPTKASMNITVTFPPGNATITVQPTQPRAGEEMTLKCSTDSSNPAAQIIWWKKGHKVLSNHVEIVDANFGGYSTTSSIKQQSTSLDDGAIFTCIASNGITDSAARDDYRLSVLYKPEFPEPLKHVTVLEGESVTVNMSATGNPSVVKYYWIRGGVRIPDQEKMITTENDHIMMKAKGPALYLEAATRKHSGSYHCIAENSQGSANATVEFNVLYPAIILNLTDNRKIDEGENTTLECWIEANPITSKTVEWTKQGTKTKLLSKSFVLGRSHLQLFKVTKEMAGVYECNAYNGIGQRDVMTVEVAVMYRPVILQPLKQKKFVFINDEEVTINCIVDARPNVTISWYLGAQIINWMPANSNYKIDFRKNGHNLWKSVLHIKNLQALTFENYTCRAENYLGYSSTTVELVMSTTPSMDSTKAVTNGGQDKDTNTSRLLWMGCAVCGALVLVLIILIIACCIRRRQRSRRRAVVALQLQRISQNEESFKSVNNTDGQPFFLSGRACERIAEEHRTTDHIQFLDHEGSWRNCSKSEEPQVHRIAHLEDWGVDQIRKLSSCESLHENNRCPDILKQYTYACKDPMERVFHADEKPEKETCFTNSSEEVSKSLLYEFHARVNKKGANSLSKYTEEGQEPLLHTQINEIQVINTS
ncbi:nephrin-like [Tachypleus tridentatus]|uniref:nephrin-like n=1 Tax=Tachypleus tridentatus TaxID=6853 RepID=UPI003FD5D6AF